jgi:thymidylate synthase (FAD)
MRIIQQSVTWFNPPPANALEIIELAGRNCYKSEERITPDSVAKFVSTLLASQHESVIEHVAASLRIIRNQHATLITARTDLAMKLPLSSRSILGIKMKAYGLNGIWLWWMPNNII